MQRVPDAPGDLRPGQHHLPRLLADRQVGVALPDPGLLGELGVEVRQRPQRLGRQLPAAAQHGQLAAARGDDAAPDEDEVAQVDVGLPRRERLLADLGEREHHLQPGAGVGGRQPLLQRREAELAGVPQEHDPPGHADDVVGLLAGRQARPACADLAQGVRPADRDRVRLPALGQQPGPLLLPDAALLGDVRGLLGVGRHGVGGLGWHRLRLVLRRSGENSRFGLRTDPSAARMSPMSSPQQPWSPGQPTPPAQPDGTAPTATAAPPPNGYGPPPQGYAPPPGVRPPAQGYGAAPSPYGQAQGYGDPQAQPAAPAGRSRRRGRTGRAGRPASWCSTCASRSARWA